MPKGSWIVVAAITVAMLLGGEALAGKGGTKGGGGKPGGGGDPYAGTPAIVYLQNRDYNGSGAGELWVMDADGKNALKLLDKGIALPPRWNPEGTAIAFGGDYNAPEGDGIYMLQLQDDGSWTGPTKIVDTWDQTFKLAWSPTAPDEKQYLAFETFLDSDDSGSSDHTDIFVVEVDLTGPVPVVNADGSGDALRVTSTPGHRERHPAFSRDGTKLAFTSNSVVGEFESAHSLILVTLSFDGAEPSIVMTENLTAGTGRPLDGLDIRQPCWARGTDRLVVKQLISAVESDFWILSVDAPENATCATCDLPSQSVNQACWSPGDLQILYNGSTASYPSGGLWLLTLGGSAPTVLVDRSGRFKAGKYPPNRYQPRWKRH